MLIIISLSFRSRQRPPLRHQKTIQSNSEDLPPSTSEESEQNTIAKSVKISAIPSTERFTRTHLSRSGSIRSLASQTSIDSVHDVVREKEEQWRQRHENSVKRKVRMQTLI